MNKIVIIVLKIIITILCVLITFRCSNSFAAPQGAINPYVMVQQVATQLFLNIKNEKESIASNPMILNDIVEQELLPHVDHKFSALKILGKHFREYKKEEIDEFVDAFKGYSVSVLSNALKYYDDQTVEFEPPQDVTDKKYAVVRMHIENADKNINLSFLVRKDSKTNEWRVYDIVAEGISMLSSLQSEFEPILRKDGLSAVIKAMGQTANIKK